MCSECTRQLWCENCYDKYGTEIVTEYCAELLAKAADRRPPHGRCANGLRPGTKAGATKGRCEHCVTLLEGGHPDLGAGVVVPPTYSFGTKPSDIPED